MHRPGPQGSFWGEWETTIFGIVFIKRTKSAARSVLVKPPGGSSSVAVPRCRPVVGE
jgi:hypothetical protein